MSIFIQKPPLGSRINQGHPLSKGLLGCWLISEGGGLKSVNLFNNKVGIITGAIWKPSGEGSSLNFGTNTTDVLKTTDNFLLYNKPCSIVSWIFPTTIDATARRVVAQDDGGGTSGVNFYILGTNTLNFLVNGTTGVQRPSANNSILLNTWSNAVVTWNGSLTATNVHFYVNGKETNYGGGTNGVGLGDNSASIIAIGSRQGGDRVFKGSISYVLIYNRVLSLNEIKSLYIAPYQFMQATKYRFYSIPSNPFVYAGTEIGAGEYAGMEIH